MGGASGTRADSSPRLSATRRYSRSILRRNGGNRRAAQATQRVRAERANSSITPAPALATEPSGRTTCMLARRSASGTDASSTSNSGSENGRMESGLPS